MRFSNSRRDSSARWLASFLILWTPFFFFSDYRGHPISAAALFYSAVLFGVAALVLAVCMKKTVVRVVLFALIVCLFLDLQGEWFGGGIALFVGIALAGLFWGIREHLELILISIFTTVLATSMVFSSNERYIDYVEAKGVVTAGRAPGMLLHVILDGFTGVGGIPQDIPGGRKLKEDITDFLQSYGFHHQSGAIAEYASTRFSLASILNFEASIRPEENVYGKRPFVVRRNKYFEWLETEGYAIHVHQSSNLEFCDASPVELASCSTYRYDGTDWLRDANLSEGEKLSVMLGMFFNLPGFFEFIGKVHAKGWAQTSKLGLDLPGLIGWDGIVAPIASVHRFSSFRNRVLVSPEGTAHFAHFVYPHSPYVFDQSCELRRQPLRWMSSHPSFIRGNTLERRAAVYPQYFTQVRCALGQMALLFDALKAEGRWASTEIILHGDHGSRLFVTSPRAQNREVLTPVDLHDGFSTLFAIKSPRYPAGIKFQTVPVSQLLKEWTQPGTRPRRDGRLPSVYLEGQNDEPWGIKQWLPLSDRRP